MQQIADWLEKLGMSEYAQRFAENGIDFSVIPHLTDQDLKDIGVLLGHRRKMLAAIAGLAGVASATSEPTVGQGPKTQDDAERRQVTVMFSDLVGSTALSARSLALVASVTKVSNMTAERTWIYPALFEDLKRLGFIEGQNVVVEGYCAEGRLESHVALAREVAGTRPDVIVALSGALASAFK